MKPGTASCPRTGVPVAANRARSRPQAGRGRKPGGTAGATRRAPDEQQQTRSRALAQENAVEGFAGALRKLIQARFPLLSIGTAEESRVLGEIAAVVGNRTLVTPARQVYLWSTSNG